MGWEGRSDDDIPFHPDLQTFRIVKSSPTFKTIKHIQKNLPAKKHPINFNFLHKSQSPTLTSHP
jgi:hypothetical protein